MGYSEIFRQAVADTWGLVWGGKVGTMLIGAAIFGLTLWLTRRFRGHASMRDTCIETIIGLGATVGVAVVLFLTHLLVVTPARMNSENVRARKTAESTNAYLSQRIETLQGSLANITGEVAALKQSFIETTIERNRLKAELENEKLGNAHRALDKRFSEFERQMMSYLTKHEPELKRKYPLGHALFTLAEAGQQVVPFHTSEGAHFDVKWDKCSFTVAGKVISLRLPEIDFRPQILTGTEIFMPTDVGSQYTINIDLNALAVGSLVAQNKFGGGIKLTVPPGGIAYANDLSGTVSPDSFLQVGNNPTVSLVVEMVAQGIDNRMLVLGMKPYSK
jgi:hypothetical protein